MCTLSARQQFVKKMKINVHVREKVFLVQCADGNQRLKWLGHVGIARYDSNNGMELGVPKGIKNAEGQELDMFGAINKLLKDEAHVWVVLSEN